jgi:8-oxo-dGTP pyrophosphatase MutT (NUDIX family)
MSARSRNGSALDRGVTALLGRQIQKFRDRLILLNTSDTAVRQAGAIPYSVVDGQPVFLLITSRRSGRWIFPKGELNDGVLPWQLAEDEAFEEAGVRGTIESTPIGSYRTMKTLALRRQPIVVDLYPLRVERQFEEWPEMQQRHRHWAILPEAKRLLSDSKLFEMAARLNNALVQRI